VIEVNIRPIAPEALLDLLPRDHFAGVLQQQCEQPEWLPLDPDSHSRLAQLAGLNIGLKESEAYL
jgi:hypothetical protein